MCGGPGGSPVVGGDSVSRRLGGNAGAEEAAAKSWGGGTLGGAGGGGVCGWFGARLSRFQFPWGGPQVTPVWHTQRWNISPSPELRELRSKEEKITTPGTNFSHGR